MPKQPKRDKALLITVLIAILALALGFAGVWAYWRYQEQRDVEVYYLSVGPVAISRDGHSMRATVAFRTSGADAEWLAQHQEALEQVVQRSLMAADPERTRGPDGVRALQEAIAAGSRTMLHTDRLRDVLVTDFLLSEGDY